MTLLTWVTLLTQTSGYPVLTARRAWAPPPVAHGRRCSRASSAPSSRRPVVVRSIAAATSPSKWSTKEYAPVTPAAWASTVRRCPA